MVDDATWVTGFLDIIDPALDTVKRLLNFGQNSDNNNSRLNDTLKYMGGGGKDGQSTQVAGSSVGGREDTETGSGFNLDAFLREKLSLDPSKIEVNLDSQRLGRFIRGRTSGA